jgi:release factor glutamine methyltransferase
LSVHTVEAGASIGSLLRASGLPRAEGELLLGRLLACERAHLIAHPERPVELAAAGKAADWFERRRCGEPIAYITGWREFYGIPLRVTPDVLIPRPETECLVDIVLERMPAAEPARVLELGTGSGAIALALAGARPDWRIIATDISQAALEVARENARRCTARVEFLQSDWFDAIEPGGFDLIVSNPPYVVAADGHLQLGDVRFEPRLALVGGASGMECIEAITTQARDRLRSGGWLVLEHGYDQGERCLALLRRLGYTDAGDFGDLAGIARVCAGRWRG